MANATIIGISGSTRRASFNTAMLRAAAEMMPADVTLAIHSIHEIPLYNGDFEAEHGVPAPVQTLKDAIAASQGLLLASPEYNNSIPGVLKNAIDWLSRPPADVGRVFGDRPVALLGATPGAGGTRFAQTAWLPVFRTLGMRPWFGRSLYVAGAAKVFGPDGAIVDDKVRALLKEFVEGYAGFVTRG